MNSSSIFQRGDRVAAVDMLCCDWRVNASGNSCSLAIWNKTLPENEENPSSDPPAAFILVLMVIVVVGGIGNGIVVSSIRKSKLRTPDHLATVNMALVDGVICLILIPLSISRLIWGSMISGSCKTIAVLGMIVYNYSLCLQGLVLFIRMRMVTSPMSKTLNWAVLGVSTGGLLALELFLSMFPTLSHGNPISVTAVGYCYIQYSNGTDQSIRHIRLFSAYFYSIRIVFVCLLCVLFHLKIIFFIRNNSARPALARQRNVIIFKRMFMKIIVWILSFTLILVVRFVDTTEDWDPRIYQAAYTLLWLNSVIHPIFQIFSKSTRHNFLFWSSSPVQPRASFGLDIAPTTITTNRSVVQNKARLIRVMPV